MEARRGARVATTFRVAIEGLDSTPIPRRGDVSITGIYFDTDQDVGGAGTIHWLLLLSADGARALRVMAYVVRTVKFTGPMASRASGAAFEFMPESDESAAALQDFVRYSLALRPAGERPHIAPRLAAEVADRTATSAREHTTVRKLSVRSMVLETSWAVEPGDTVKVDIAAPGMSRRIRLDGRATRVAPHTEGAGRGAPPRSYTIEVEVEDESDGPLRKISALALERPRPGAEAPRHVAAPAPERIPRVDAPFFEEAEVSGVLDNLLSALIVPTSEVRKRTHHLSGELSRVRLSTLCALFEMDRMSGELVVHRGGQEVRVYVAEGRLVDVEPVQKAESVRARLRETLLWGDGAFEFYVQPVDRTDRIGTSTTALLLDLAREADEAARARSAENPAPLAETRRVP